MKLKIAMDNPVPRFYDYIRERGFDVDEVRFSRNDDEESIEKLRGYSAVIAMNESYSAKVLDALGDSLKIVARHGIGYDLVDVDHATQLGICCCNTLGVMSSGVAETTLAMLLELARGFYIRNAAMSQGIWQRGEASHQLEGSTVGLVGFGATAQKVAQYLVGFGCRVLAYDVAYNEEAVRRFGVEKASIDTIARESDFVSIHVPLLPETRQLVNAEFLKKMKNSAYLINTSRGGTVDERALIAALQSGEIAGAGLDVFEQEPTPADNPLRKMENCFLTPHVATHTYECRQACIDALIECFHEFEAGQIPRFCLNKEYVNYILK